jgi:serine/threonine protein kinase
MRPPKKSISNSSSEKKTAKHSKTVKKTVIGEGSYGCVIKPTLKCKGNKKIDYENKISKVMSNYHANEELREYSKIDKIDVNDKYYLGVPEICSFDEKKRENVKVIRNCKINADEFLEKIENLSLLVMNDGGESLRSFADKVAESKQKSFLMKCQEYVERFWIESYVLLEGINLYLENGTVHHDVKPQNIVYDYKSNSLKFIDFGLMTVKNDIIEKSEKNDYDLAIYHWSYPLEMYYYNKEKYIELCDRRNKQAYFEDTLDKLNDLTHESSLKDAIKYLFNFIFNKKPEYKEEFKKFFEKNYREMIVYNYEDADNYEKFMKDSIKTLDIYGLGISFFYVLNSTEKYLNKKMKEDIKELCFHMLNPDLFKRIKIRELLVDYQTILEESGLLEKYGKKIENHKLIDYDYSVKMETPTLDLRSIDMTKKEIMEFITNEELDCDPRKTFDRELKKCITKKYKGKKDTDCLEGKERNPYTKKCNNKCKYGYSRNNLFHCRKTKKGGNRRFPT